jgi:hypothetical protein
MVNGDDDEIAEVRRMIAPSIAFITDEARRHAIETLVIQSYKDVRADNNRAISNVARSLALLNLQKGLTDVEPERATSQEATDLLRAVVVFAHAALEDHLRTLGLRLLPFAPAAVLDLVPLEGLNENNRAEKFLLGRLAPFRDTRVQDLISRSVASYLSRWSFSSAKDIASLFEKIQVSDALLKPFYPRLEELMVRRHQIVHRADIVGLDSDGRPVLAPIDPAMVRGWIEHGAKFLSEVNKLVGMNTLLPKVIAARGGS